MKIKQHTSELKRLFKGLGFSLLLMTQVSAQEPVTEEDENVSEQGTIKVVGSRIRTTDIEGVSPVLVVSREDLEVSGHNTIQDYVRTQTHIVRFGLLRL